ncbi:MAG: GOLPH3/VPS74 family protein [Stackebrandtia sp.]
MMILAEELQLLAMDDRGVKTSLSDLNTGSVGAALLDLALAERVDLVDKKVVVTNPSPTAHPVLDEVSRQIATDKPRTPQGWTTMLYWKLSRQVVDTMVDRGLVRREKKKFLGMFPSTRHPSTSPSARTEIQQRLASAAANGQAPDARTAALAALVHSLGMEKQALPELPSGEAKKALKSIADSSWASDATMKAVQATQSAMVTAITTAAITTTITTSGS